MVEEKEDKGPKAIISKLHDQCSAAIEASFSDGYDQINGQSYAFATELDAWIRLLDSQYESDLYRTAAAEYVSALLSASQAKYRDAFKSLRLVLELISQGVYLSANLVLLDEWLSSKADTNWQAILDNDKGIFSKRFCRAFLQEAIDDIPAFKTLAETLYREMSECTHGNVPNKIPLPTEIAFFEETFLLWHEKAKTLRLLVNFILAMRYLSDAIVEGDDLGEIRPILLEQLGHVAAIRVLVGGPA